MSTKESAGFKLAVVLVVGGVLVGLAVAKSKLGGDSDQAPSPTTPVSVSSATPTVTASVAAKPIASMNVDAGVKPTSGDRVALLEAARAGNVDVVRQLIDKGVELDEVLILEADEHDAVTAVLLGRGVKEPTLFVAIEKTAPKAVARLLAAKKDPNAKNDAGETPLFVAAKQGTVSSPKRVAIVKALLDAGAKPDEGTTTETPLHAALHRYQHESDNLDVVKLLMTKATVDPETMMDALGVLSPEKKDAVMDVLLGGKVSPAAVFRGVATTRDPKMVAKLNAKSAINWRTKDPQVEDSPLVTAALSQDVELVKALLAAGAPADGLEDASETPLLTTINASTPGSEDALKIANALLAKGANANRKSKDGRRPLHAAAERNQVAILNALLAKGANINDEVNGTTPLEAAEAAGNEDVAKALKAKGAKARAPKP